MGGKEHTRVRAGARAGLGWTGHAVVHERGVQLAVFQRCLLTQGSARQCKGYGRASLQGGQEAFFSAARACVVVAAVAPKARNRS